MRKLLICVCVLLAFLGVADLTIEYQFGTEFSPDAFQHRMYHRYSFMGRPITRKIYEDKKWALDEYLHRKGLIPPSDLGEPRWWLVQCFDHGRSDWGSLGKGYDICLRLQTFPSERDYWVPWSEKHPDIAKVLWPQVVVALREDQLEEAVRLLSAAESSETLHEFLEEANADK